MSTKTVTLALVALAALPDDRIAKLPISTQVREDLFAGFMVNDMERFAKGVKRLDAILAEQPAHPIALAWEGAVLLFNSTRAHAQGDAAEFRRLYGEAMKLFDTTHAAHPKNEGVLAIHGAAATYFADRLPQPQRNTAYATGLARFKELENIQQPVLSKLPVHIKGELLAGMAQAEQRLGNWEGAKGYLERIVAEMEGTPYQTRARSWLAKPETAAKSSLSCMTCHEPGRLEPRLAALDKK